MKKQRYGLDVNWNSGAVDEDGNIDFQARIGNGKVPFYYAHLIIRFGDRQVAQSQLNKYFSPNGK